MAARRRRFDVLRMVFPAADDNDFFEPAGDVQLAVAQETQIAGPQEWAFARVSQPGIKGLLGLSRPLPVSARLVCARDPDLADLAGWANRLGNRIDDAHICRRS